MTTSNEAPRILIVADNASARFGGEAALPLHYFRVMRRRGLPVWLITHARTRTELSTLYPNDDHILYVEDSAWHVAMWKLGSHLPSQIAYFTTGFLSRVAAQRVQRRLIKNLVREQGIQVVHQPTPVSPREPSLLHGLGVPVVIGPMNGGMDYPPAFQAHRTPVERALVAAGRASAYVLNAVFAGKRLASLLLVANERTRRALPAGVCPNVIELVENGVDLTLWRASADLRAPDQPDRLTTFVFMGRLVDWKAVDLLLQAFATARSGAPMTLWILGDGPERANLEALADRLDLDRTSTTSPEASNVHPRSQGMQPTTATPPTSNVEPGGLLFAGWRSQAECAAILGSADCLVLPSLLECGGAVVLEAMSMGRAVIATAWGGPLDYLDATCGILVQPTSREAVVEGFARAMVDLAQAPAQCRSMGQHGKAKVQAEYDWEIKVDRVLRAYRELDRHQ